MPNDNQPARSYVAAVLARADGATEGPWKAGRADMKTYDALSGDGPYKHVYVASELPEDADDDVPAKGYGPNCIANAQFIAASRQDIPTLAKIALRAIEALGEVIPWLERETPPQYVGVDREGLPVEYEPTAAEEACGMAAMVLGAALADINALAAKGSQ